MTQSKFHVEIEDARKSVPLLERDETAEAYYERAHEAIAGYAVAKFKTIKDAEKAYNEKHAEDQARFYKERINDQILYEKSLRHDYEELHGDIEEKKKEKSRLEDEISALSEAKTKAYEEMRGIAGSREQLASMQSGARLANAFLSGLNAMMSEGRGDQAWDAVRGMGFEGSLKITEHDGMHHFEPVFDEDGSLAATR